MALGDILKGIATDVITDMLKKVGTGKRKRRRARTLTATERLSRIKKLLTPAKRQTSRKKTVRARSRTKQRP